MRRLCTEQEKRILRSHWRNLCTGFAGKSVYPKVRDIFFVLIAWGTTVLASINCVGKFMDDWMLFYLYCGKMIIVSRLVKMGLFTIRVNRLKKRFLEKKQLFINGATVVDVKRSGIHIAYTYVEDECLYEGESYGITVETRIGNVPNIKVSDRLLILYGEVPEGTQGEFSLQIMRLSPKLEEKILHNQGENREKLKNIKKLRCFPHPNATIIKKEKRVLEPEEKKEAAAQFLQKQKKSLQMTILVCGVFFLIIINTTTALLLGEGILKNGLRGSALAVYLFATAVAGILLVFMWHVEMKRFVRRSMEISYV